MDDADDVRTMDDDTPIEWSCHSSPYTEVSFMTFFGCFICLFGLLQSWRVKIITRLHHYRYYKCYY